MFENVSKSFRSDVRPREQTLEVLDSKVGVWRERGGGWRGGGEREREIVKMLVPSRLDNFLSAGVTSLLGPISSIVANTQTVCSSAAAIPQAEPISPPTDLSTRCACLQTSGLNR